MEAARLMHTARQMVDTPRLWLMRWPRNAISLLVRARGLKDDEACELLRALQVTAVKYGLGLSSQPKVRRGVKEATDARGTSGTAETLGRNSREAGAGVSHEERC